MGIMTETWPRRMPPLPLLLKVEPGNAEKRARMRAVILLGKMRPVGTGDVELSLRPLLRRIRGTGDVEELSLRPLLRRIRGTGDVEVLSLRPLLPMIRGTGDVEVLSLRPLLPM